MACCRRPTRASGRTSGAACTSRRQGRIGIAVTYRATKADTCRSHGRARSLLEEGHVDEAEAEKTRIEEKQRASRRADEAAGRPWQPMVRASALPAARLRQCARR